MKRQSKILLIDDDIDFVNATKTVLESRDYQIIVANNGDEGLKKAYHWFLDNQLSKVE